MVPLTAPTVVAGVKLTARMQVLRAGNDPTFPLPEVCGHVVLLSKVKSFVVAGLLPEESAGNDSAALPIFCKVTF